MRWVRVMKRFRLLGVFVMALTALGSGLSPARSARIKSQKSQKPNKPTELVAHQRAYATALRAVYGDNITPCHVPFEEGPFTAQNLKKPDWMKSWKAYIDLYMFSVLSCPVGTRAAAAFSQFMGNLGAAMLSRRELDVLDTSIHHKKSQLSFDASAQSGPKINEMSHKRDEMRLKLKLTCKKLDEERKRLVSVLKEREQLWKDFIKAVHASRAYKNKKARAFFDQKVSSVQKTMFDDAHAAINKVERTCDFQKK